MMSATARAKDHRPRPAAGHGDASSGRLSCFYDRRYEAYSRRVLPGDYYVTGAKDEMIVTVLGSCVAACIRDPRTGYGGLNHFMLPQSDTGEWNGVSAATRYGNHAMEALINEILKSGCSRENLEIKVFGGANVAVGPSMVGRKNCEFVLHYLADEGLRVIAQDLGGPQGRRIHYFPATGKVGRVFLKRTSEALVVNEERQYVSKLDHVPVDGGIELFD